jgi:hypothetical protein
MDDQKFFEALREVVGNLSEITEAQRAQLRQSTELTSLLRGKLNDLLWSGMIQLQGTSGDWTYEQDFVVDFAAVGFIDSLEAGPYTISVDAMGGSNGPGTFQTGVTLSAVVPMVGKHLSIMSTSDSDTAPQLFVTIFTTLQPLISQ